MLILASSVLGQSAKKIFGYVFDQKSNLPLVGANILIEGTSIGASTDELGYFQFDNLYMGTYSITASYIGYERLTLLNIEVQRDQSAEINVFLEQAANQLDEVLIYSQDGSSKIISNIKLYTREDLDKSSSPSVGEFLERTPGVEIISTGGIGSSKKISIRGSETNQVLVMLDGIPLNNQLGGDADLSKIPINIVERIEIYKGGSSFKFGSGAIGGAVNVITKKNFKSEYKINIVGGSYGLMNFEPSISGNIKNISYFLSYNQLQSSGDYPYNYENTSGEDAKSKRINAGLKSQNFFTRINYKIDNYLFSVSAQKLDSDRGLPGKTNALTPYARSTNRNTIIGSNFKATFSNIVWDLIGSYSHGINENSNLYSDNVPIKYKRYPQYHYKYESDITVLNTTFYFKPSEWLYLTTGYNGKWFIYNDENYLYTNASSIDNAKDISHGVFLHQEFKVELPKPFNSFSVTPVIRYDEIRMSNEDINRYENQWSPSLALHLSMGEKHKIYLKSSISRSFRVPTFADLFYQDVRVEGKSDLLPEKSLNKEIALGWEINKYGKLKGEMTFYQYRIDNMIVWKLGSFEVFRPFNNDAEITGQEYSLSYQLPKQNLSFNIGYTYLQPLDKNNQETTYNKIIPYRSQHSFKSSMQFGYKEFTGIINYRFVGKRFVTVANTVELSPYNVMDLTMLQNISIGKLQTVFKFSVNNLTSEFYEIIRNYPIPGREYRLGVTLTY